MTLRSTLLLLALSMAPLPAAPAESTLILEPAVAANLRLEFAEAGEAPFETTFFALGRIEAMPDRVATLSSRIPGRVAAMLAGPGDPVEAGKPVLRVESRQPGDPPPVVPLHAPLSGTITRLNTRLGQPVEPETPLLEITDLSEVDAVAQVPEYALGPMTPGMEARVRVSSFPDEVFTGRLVRIGSRVDPASGMATLFFRLSNPEGRLRPGMRANFSIVTASREAVMSVPKAAVEGEGPGRFVFVKHFDLPNAFVRTPVEIGESNDERVEIRKGLFPGDEVVTRGAYLLSQMGGASPVSLKEALDAAHGHEHAEDGSELTPEKRKELEAAKGDRPAGGEEAHAHPAAGRSPWLYVSAVLFLLWIATLSGRFLRPLASTRP